MPDWHTIQIPKAGVIQMTLLRREDFVKRNHLGGLFLLEWKVDWASGAGTIGAVWDFKALQWGEVHSIIQIPDKMRTLIETAFEHVSRDIAVGDSFQIPCDAPRELNFEANFGTVEEPHTRIWYHLGNQTVGKQVRFRSGGKVSFSRTPRSPPHPPIEEGVKEGERELKQVVLAHKAEILEMLRKDTPLR